MKLLKLLFFFIINVGFSQEIPIDKQRHFAAGFVLGELSVMNKEVKHPFWTSVAVSTSAGLVKESYDKRMGGKFDRYDLGVTITGGIIAGGIGYLIKRNKIKKQRRQEDLLNRIYLRGPYSIYH